jgi:hypothetical protein
MACHSQGGRVLPYSVIQLELSVFSRVWELHRRSMPDTTSNARQNRVKAFVRSSTVLPVLPLFDPMAVRSM